MTAFSERLIKFRKQKGLSQEQLGAAVGVTRQTVSKWELGDTTPELGKLVQLSDYFQISVDELVGHAAENHGDSAVEINGVPAVWHYEYKSKRTLFGVPLVHINLGHGPRRARGIIAVGNLSRGVIAFGGLAVGILSFGACSLGMFSLGGLSLGLLVSAGGLSVGALAFGGLAIGLFAVGGCAFGVYSIGGCAIASKIAAGGYAHGPIAIGDRATGDVVFRFEQGFRSGDVRRAITEMFPGTWGIIADIFSAF